MQAHAGNTHTFFFKLKTLYTHVYIYDICLLMQNQLVASHLIESNMKNNMSVVLCNLAQDVIFNSSSFLTSQAVSLFPHLACIIPLFRVFLHLYCSVSETNVSCILT